MTLHDEVEEFKDMAGIGRQARPYKERKSVLAPHSATIYELLFSEQLTIYQVWQFLCRRRGICLLRLLWTLLHMLVCCSPQVFYIYF